MFFNSNKEFDTLQIPDLTGKVAIVTGSNTGIGKCTALELARKGAQVFLACRSRERTDKAIDEIRKDLGAAGQSAKLEFLELDLTSLESVNKAVDQFVKLNLPLHILINNAGIMALPEFQTSVDGFELQFATNHIGHFQFTLGLLPVLEKSAPSRIVNLASLAHQSAKRSHFEVEGLAKINDRASYSPWTNYGITKACNILFSLELNKRLQKRGITNVLVNSVHPGVINTELTRYMRWYVQLLKPVLGIFLLSPAKGALTSLYVATHPDIAKAGSEKHAKYFVPIAQESEPTEVCKDEQLAADLWAFTEKIIAEKLKQ